MPQKVLLTSFGPFGLHEENPSEAVVGAVVAEGVEGTEIVTHSFPVAYDDVADKIPQLWSEHQPQGHLYKAAALRAAAKNELELVIHVGVYTRGVVSVENQTFNRGYCRADIHGLVPKNNICVKEESEKVLKTSLDVTAVVEAVRTRDDYAQFGVEVEESCDPGRYLCAFSYATSLGQARQKPDVGVLFVHIPMRERRPINASAAALKAIITETLTKLNQTNGKAA